MSMGGQAQDPARHRGGGNCLDYSPGGDFPSTHVLDGAGPGAAQGCAMHISIKKLAGWNQCGKKMTINDIYLLTRKKNALWGEVYRARAF